MPDLASGGIGLSPRALRERSVAVNHSPDMDDRRLSVCYVAPAQNLLPSAGPTRNVLSLAHALAEWADVTVAFRRVLDPAHEGPARVLEIDPGAAPHPRPVDDAAVRDVGYRAFATYLMAVRRFAREQLPAFDVVLEKSWLLSGDRKSVV